jgi:hypothetical protein
MRGNTGRSSGRTNRSTNDQLSSFVRQATILRKNFTEWDNVLKNPQRGEDWTTMLGRYNAAYNQILHFDTTIDDVMEHFVYVPQRATANPQDIPFFLSTRLETPPITTTVTAEGEGDPGDNQELGSIDTVQHLIDYENYAAQLAQEYYRNQVLF